MASVIKAKNSLPDGTGAPFNLEDISRRADERLETARHKAAQIVAEAQEQAGAIRQHAVDFEHPGYGKTNGTDAKQSPQVEPLIAAMRAAIDQIVDTRQAWQTHWEHSAVQLATAIAAKVIRREVARDPQISLTLIREALELSAGSSQIRVLLHPDDVKALGRQVKKMAKDISRVAAAEIVADTAIPRGACKVETRFGSIDQSFDEQLKRIEQELTQSNEE